MKYFAKPKIMKGRARALCLAIFIFSCSMLSAFAPYLSPTASAAGPDQQSLTVAGKDISCYAKLNASQNVEDLANSSFKRSGGRGNSNDYIGTQALTSVANEGSTPKQAAADFKAALNGSNRVTISFDSQDQPSKTPCQQAAIFVQDSADNKKFYGILYTGSKTSCAGRAGCSTSYNYEFISATVNTSNHKASFSTGHPAMTLSGYSDSYFPGGAGGITAGSSTCPHFSQAKDAKTTEICMKAFGAPEFFDFATINYGGGTFKLEKWGGSTMRYKLASSSSDPNWLKGGDTHLDLSTDNANTDFNLDHGAGSLNKQLKEFKLAIEGASGEKVSMKLTNMGISKDGSSDLVVKNADLSDVQYVAYYYPNGGTPSIVTAATSADTNEQNYIGSYDKINATTFRLGDATASGCKSDSSRPEFVLDIDPTTAGTSTTVGATWNMPDDKCSYVPVHVSIQVKDASATPPTITKGDSNQSAADKQSCESGGGPIGWIMCAVIDTLADAVNGIYTQIIIPMMQTPSLSASSSQGTALFKAWSSFRVFGNIFLVIIILIVVFGESIGGGMLDAYTIKKILPRILIGAIMINLSFYACALFIDLTNIIGNGLRLLITGSFGLDGNDFNLKNVNGATQTGFLGVSGAGVVALFAAADGPAILIAAITIIFTILPMLLLLFIAIMGVLALRLGLIYAIVLFSPVAFALWVLPNTEKYFKKWFELLQTTAMVFPIVSGLFGLSMVLAQTTIFATGSKGAINGTIGYILSLIIVVMPLILIPFAFKLAGGILGRAYDLANNGRSMGNNFLKKRGDLRKQRMQNGTFFNPKGLGGTGLGSRLNRSLQRNAVRSANENDEARGSRFGLPGSSGRRAIIDDAIGARKTAHRDAYVKQMKELYGGDEDKVRAAMESYDEHGNNFSETKFRANMAELNRQHMLKNPGVTKYSEDDINQALTKVQRTRTQMGDTAFQLASSHAMMSNGTVNADDNEKVMKWINNATHGDKQAGINWMLGAAEEAKAAGRVDTFSSSPSDNIKAYLHETGQQRSAEIDAAGGTTEWLLQRAKVTRSPGELAMMKGDGIERMAPLMVDDVKTQQRVVVQSDEYRTEQATRQSVQQAEQVLTTVSNNRQAVAAQVENARAQVTHGGTATPDQQKVINDALQAQRDVELEYQRSQGEYQNRVSVHSAARDALESTGAHKELMHQLARVKGMEDIAGQIPDGKAKAYVETAFAAKGIIGVGTDADGNQVDIEGDDSLSKLYNSREVTGNETFRMYHKEYTDAESLRSVAAQAAQAAAAGATGTPPGGPAGPNAGPTML